MIKNIIIRLKILLLNPGIGLIFTVKEKMKIIFYRILLNPIGYLIVTILLLLSIRMIFIINIIPTVYAEGLDSETIRKIQDIYTVNVSENPEQTSADIIRYNKELAMMKQAYNKSQLEQKRLIFDISRLGFPIQDIGMSFTKRIMWMHIVSSPRFTEYHPITQEYLYSLSMGVYKDPRDLFANYTDLFIHSDDYRNELLNLRILTYNDPFISKLLVHYILNLKMYLDPELRLSIDEYNYYLKLFQDTGTGKLPYHPILQYTHRHYHNE
jgi:hypothetical protein